MKTDTKNTKDHEEKKKIDRFTRRGLIHQTQQVNHQRKGLINQAPTMNEGQYFHRFLARISYHEELL